MSYERRHPDLPQEPPVQLELIGLYRGGGQLVRDSKDPAGGTLTFAPAAWRSFISHTSGTPDLPHQRHPLNVRRA